MNRIVGRCNRIALHVPTGRLYLVQQVQRQYNAVFCWGEVEGFKGLRTYHGRGKQFPIEEVQVAPCLKDEQLITKLAIQRCEVEGRPYWFTRRGNMRIGKPGQHPMADLRGQSVALLELLRGLVTGGRESEPLS